MFDVVSFDWLKADFFRLEFGFAAGVCQSWGYGKVIAKLPSLVNHVA
jgi:hypothetical protein